MLFKFPQRKRLPHSRLNNGLGIEQLENRFALEASAAPEAVTAIEIPGIFENAGPPTGFDFEAVEPNISPELTSSSVYQLLQSNLTHGNLSHGIAITETNPAGGTLWYSKNGGFSWSDVGTVSETTPLALSINDHLYYEPAHEYHGTILDVFVYRPWDGTFSYDSQPHEPVLPSLLAPVETVALSDDGNTLIIGSPTNDKYGAEAGLIQVFSRSEGTTWQLLKEIGGLPGDRFGTSVAITGHAGTIVAVSAPGGDFEGADNVGYVKAFANIGTEAGLVQLGEPIYGTSENGEFGSAIAIKGEPILIVGAANGSNTFGQRTGAVYTYTFSNLGLTSFAEPIDQIAGLWHESKSPLYGFQPESRFGAAISVDWRYVAIGAPGFSQDVNASGAAYVYRASSQEQQWAHVGDAVMPAYSEHDFGHSVALSGMGQTLIVGSPSLNSNGGQVSIYHSQYNSYYDPLSGQSIDTSDYVRTTTLSGDGDFGASVLLSENGYNLVVGTQDASVSQDQNPTFLAYNLTAEGNATLTNSVAGNPGIAADLSADGGTLAVSKPSVDGQGSPVLQLIPASIASSEAPVEKVVAAVTVTPRAAESDAAPRPILVPQPDVTITQSSFNAPPIGAVGELVRGLVRVSGDVSATEPIDGNGLGVAIVSAEVGDGTLWYTTDDGRSWQTASEISPSSALVLHADANTRVFLQLSNAGILANDHSIRFKAWNRSEFVNGQQHVDTTASSPLSPVVEYDLSPSMDYASVPLYSNNNKTAGALGYHKSGLVAASHFNRLVLFDASEPTAPIFLSDYVFHKADDVSASSWPESQVTSVQFLGRDTLAVCVLEATSSWEAMAYTYYLDVSSTTAPRLISVEAGSSSLFWHEAIGVAYKVRPESEFVDYGNSYLRPSAGQVQPIDWWRIELTDADTEMIYRPDSTPIWIGMNNGEWYGYEPSYSQDLGLAQTSVLLRLDSAGRIHRTILADAIARPSPQLFFTPDLFFDSSTVTQIASTTSIEGEGTASVLKPASHRLFQTITMAETDSTGVSYIGGDRLQGANWDGVLQVDNLFAAYPQSIAASFAVEGEVGGMALDNAEEFLFVTDTAGKLYVLAAKADRAFSYDTQIATFSVAGPGVGEAQQIYRGVLPDIVIAPPSVNSGASVQVAIDAALAVVPEEVQVTVFAYSQNPAIVGNPVVIVDSSGRPQSLAINGVPGSVGSTTIRMTVETGGQDKLLSTTEDNRAATYSFRFTQLRPYSADAGGLAVDQDGVLYVESAPLTLSGRQLEETSLEFDFIRSETTTQLNHLIVSRDGTNYRLIADEDWKIVGIFDSLQNEVSPVLDLENRGISRVANITIYAGAYEIEAERNPTLIVRRGQIYTFDLSVPGHSFYLQTSGGGYSPQSIYSDGFLGNGEEEGRFDWTVSEDTPDELFYQSELDADVFGKIVVFD